MNKTIKIPVAGVDEGTPITVHNGAFTLPAFVNADAEEVRKILAESDAQEAKMEGLFHGYTEEQWKIIRDGRYLCEFGDYHYLQGLRAVDRINTTSAYPFGIGSTNWKLCRPTQRYGVLAPHFGGPKPEWLKDDDMIVYMREGNEFATPFHSCAMRASSVVWRAVCEFIAMPGDSKE